VPGPDEPDQGPNKREVLQVYLRFSHLGLQFGATVALFTWGGFWLDRRLGVVPLFTVIGLSVGFGAGFYSLYRAVYTSKP